MSESPESHRPGLDFSGGYKLRITTGVDPTDGCGRAELVPTGDTNPQDIPDLSRTLGDLDPTSEKARPVVPGEAPARHPLPTDLDTKGPLTWERLGQSQQDHTVSDDANTASPATEHATDLPSSEEPVEPPEDIAAALHRSALNAIREVTVDDELRASLNAWLALKTTPPAPDIAPQVCEAPPEPTPPPVGEQYRPRTDLPSRKERIAAEKAAAEKKATRGTRVPTWATGLAGVAMISTIATGIAINAGNSHGSDIKTPDPIASPELLIPQEQTETIIISEHVTMALGSSAMDDRARATVDTFEHSVVGTLRAKHVKSNITGITLKSLSVTGVATSDGTDDATLTNADKSRDPGNNHLANEREKSGEIAVRLAFAHGGLNPADIPEIHGDAQIVPLSPKDSSLLRAEAAAQGITSATRLIHSVDRGATPIFRDPQAKTLIAQYRQERGVTLRAELQKTVLSSSYSLAQSPNASTTNSQVPPQRVGGTTPPGGPTRPQDAPLSTRPHAIVPRRSNNPYAGTIVLPLVRT